MAPGERTAMSAFSVSLEKGRDGWCTIWVAELRGLFVNMSSVAAAMRALPEAITGYLQWLERPSGERALQLVSHGETDTCFAKFFGSCHDEAEVVANLCDGRALEIGAGRLGPVHVIRVQVD